MEWFFKQNGQQQGPVSTSQIKELVVSGQMPPGQPIWRRDAENVTFVRAEALFKS